MLIESPDISGSYEVVRAQAPGLVRKSMREGKLFEPDAKNRRQIISSADRYEIV